MAFSFPSIIPSSASTDLSGINNSGQIVGTYMDSSGKENGFLATPTPEPCLAGPLVFSLAILYMLRRKAVFHRRELS
jgi:hypothetical protein